MKLNLGDYRRLFKLNRSLSSSTDCNLKLTASSQCEKDVDRTSSEKYTFNQLSLMLFH